MEEYLESQGSFKSGIFCVDVALGKIFTLDNLRKMNVIVVEWCYMCNKSGESIDYLLHCEVVRDLWSSLFNLFGFELGRSGGAW